MKKNKCFLFFAVFAISIVFSSCNNDEPELDEGEYVDTETPGFYEIRTECTPETLCFSYNGCQYSLSDLFTQYIDMFHYMEIETCVVKNLYGYTLQEFNPDKENCTLEYFNIPPTHIVENSTNEKGENFLERWPDYDGTNIMYYIFSYCIDGSAFDGCDKLESLEMYSDLAITGVNKIAFQGCDNLTDIYVYGWKLPCVESKKFALDYDKVTLHVSENLDDACFDEYPWKRFKHVEKDLPPIY